MDPCAIIIFGATGDLARQKLIPALHLLDRQLDDRTRIICVGRKEHTAASIAKEYRAAIKDRKGWERFARRIAYHRLEFHDGAAYDALSALVDMPNRLFYLATPQDAFPLIITHLSRTGLAQRSPKEGWHRVVFEKPFGSDLRSARALNKEVTRLFAEEQIHRIDHYLGKSFVQEIMVLRFANPLFEYDWSSRYIERVEITVSERQGIGARAPYYDNAGAIRDMIQNHLLQLLSLVAMEPPASFSPEAIRDCKVQALRDIGLPWRGTLRKRLVCGQYTAGSVDGKAIPAYRDEQGVRPDSTTETFALVQLEVRNARWKGTPFYLMTGKALRERYAEIAIHFRPGPWLKFPNPAGKVDENVLLIRIQPEEGLRIRFNLADVTGSHVVTPHMLDFAHEATRFNSEEAYRLLLGDVIRGDHTLFSRWDFVEQSWRIADAVRAAVTTVHPYQAGSDGPEAAIGIIRHQHEPGLPRGKRPAAAPARKRSRR